jgi:Transposase, Mutator family
MSQDETDGSGGELVPAGDLGSMRDWAEQLVARARQDGVALTGEGGLLTDTMRHVLQTGLEVEMAEHLGYSPYEWVGRGSDNSRNGAYDKTVTTEIGEVELRVPRDRQGTFEPSCDDPGMAVGLARVRAVPRVSSRTAQGSSTPRTRSSHSTPASAGPSDIADTSLPNKPP